jgi:hypothetical protein
MPMPTARTASADTAASSSVPTGAAERVRALRRLPRRKESGMEFPSAASCGSVRFGIRAVSMQ